MDNFVVRGKFLIDNFVPSQTHVSRNPRGDAVAIYDFRIFYDTQFSLAI